MFPYQEVIFTASFGLTIWRWCKTLGIILIPVTSQVQ